MALNRQQANETFLAGLDTAKAAGCEIEYLAEVGRSDLFFLLTVILKRQDANKDWIYDRCREVQDNPNNMLDLWAREHYKSTIITFALTIQEIIKNPEVTVGIFSHTKSIAKGFLRQIKLELELNTGLSLLYPDIFWDNPQKESPKWSEDDGIIVKRNSNPNASTVAAHGLVDGQPTSKHYDILLYDDVVTVESVSTPEQIKKTTDAWSLSLNLGARGGRIRYAGTRYHMLDTYGEIISREAATTRIHAATDDGTETGEPVLLTREELRDKRKAMGPYIFAAQMLLDPVADKAMGFKKEWLKYYNKEASPPKAHWNKYLMCDPAGSRKKGSDYTVMLVVALADDGNMYLVDGCRVRLNLTGRANRLLALHRKWKPIHTGYEKYGKDSDIEHIKTVMETEAYRFNITELGGMAKKEDRIGSLVPQFEQGKFYIPDHLHFIDEDKVVRDLTHEFVHEEYLFFPVSTHDDILDCMARINTPEMMTCFPTIPNEYGAPDAPIFANSKYNPLQTMGGQ